MGVQCSFEVVALRLVVRTVQQHVGRSSWHLEHAGPIPRTYFAEYLSGGLRVFAVLVKVCRQEDKLSVRRFHSPTTNFFVRE
ncbi:hypothetical protein DPMN_163738 [Dreissena polymorpha]|uniref:Uncharacterized protein n=1 Tax=Dreissena polymorpha TaxID=45954 RepID=A0A9D4IUP7_DREPO|nr:hypothetical protein DPMN_163738 [Dreissena polymorpha]